MWYIFTFSLACLSLIGWFLRPTWKHVGMLRTLFWVGLGSYLWTIGLSSPSWIFALETLVRDFFFIGFSVLIAGVVKGRIRQILLPLAISGVALFVYGRYILAPTFTRSSDIALDSQGELLVEVKPGYSRESVEALLQPYGVQLERAFFPQASDQTTLDSYFVVDIPQNRIHQLSKIERILRNSNAVAWVEGNEVIQLDPTIGSSDRAVTDPSKYGLNDPDLGELWAFESMDMQAFFNLLQTTNIKPAKKALIAILDTGVDAKHVDIKGNYRSLRSTFDNDPKGHGTHCAGIAAAVSNNNTGIASFSTNNQFVQVTSVKVLGAGGVGTQKSIIEGMLLAVDNGADVLSMSLGGPGNSARQKAYEQAVQYAGKKGAIVVAAAGNSNRNARDFSPANTPGVLCVSAVDQQLNRADFSNSVQDIPMAVAAPGVDIYSTIPNGQYARYSGTSMATPYVAGLVGLMKSIRPELRAQQIHEFLVDSGKPTRNSAQTGKLIQPARAVRKVLER